ncbi:MAG: TolB family protein [Myxococcota bacterium]
MGRPQVLRHSGIPSLLLALSLSWPSLAFAQSTATPDAFLEPVRLTAGIEDQLMPSISADEETLLYASNRSATWELQRLKLRGGIPEPLLNLAGDALWPEVSPRGDQVAFISARDDAQGDVCIAPLLSRLTSNNTGVVDNPAQSTVQCLTDGETADSRVLWREDGKSLLVLQRQRGGKQYRVMSLDPQTRAQSVLLEENLVHPALSPDGKRLAYVPIQARQAQVSVSLLRRSSGPLRIQALTPKTPPHILEFSLPGVSNFPAFSPDGQFLYFSQYLNDTNADGMINGDDHSVIFRVKLNAEGYPSKTSSPEQLTSAAWNCQYPRPARTHLYMTCAHEGSLDLYRLPLSGSIPPQWGLERLDEELEASRILWHKLQLASRMLELEKTPVERLALVRELIRLHLALQEYESAEFYLRETLALDPTDLYHTRQDASVLQALIALRRQERLLSDGKLSPLFLQQQQAQISQLQQLARPQQQGLPPLAQGVLAELLDTLGNKAEARKLLRSLPWEDVQEPFHLHVLASLADKIWLQTDARTERLEVLRRLTQHPRLAEREQLRYAEQFTRALLRGIPIAKRRALLHHWLQQMPASSSLALVLTIEGWLLQLQEASAPSEAQEPVRAGLFALYKEHKSFDRRKALILATVRAAATLDGDVLLYEFSNTWVSGLKRGTAERRYAEGLYRAVVLERAYASWRRQNFGDARGHFFGVTLQRDDLEAYMGFLQARRKEGKTDGLDQLQKRFGKTPDAPPFQFAQLYDVVLAWEADPALQTPAAITELLERLEKVQTDMPGTLETQLLAGWLAHQRFRQGQAGIDALRAQQSYRLALDLARERPRARATLLSQLALLSGELGSWREAQDFLQQRLKLLILKATEKLALELLTGKVYFHLGQAAAAHQLLEQTLTWLSQEASLQSYKPLVLDRAILYAWSAGQLERAWSLHQMQPEPSQTNTQEERKRLLSWHVQRAAIGGQNHPKEALTSSRRALELLADPQPLLRPDENAPAGGQYVFPRERYRLLVLGLQAQALAGQAQLKEALSTLEQRRVGLERLLKEEELDEDRLDIIKSFWQEGLLLHRLGRSGEAVQRLEAGLAQEALYRENTGSPTTEPGIKLLRDLAEIHLYGKLDLAGKVNLKAALKRTSVALMDPPNPRYQEERYLFRLYLILLELPP